MRHRHSPDHVALQRYEAEYRRNTAPGDPALALPFDFDGPPVPSLSAMVSRDATGRATIRTVRLPQPLRVDGRLDEAVYGRVTPITDFLQQDPVEGVAASEKTEFWIFFDE
jgi:hypothetical protein